MMFLGAFETLPLPPYFYLDTPRCVCVRQLRWVRKQYNEYESLKLSLLAASLMLVTYRLIINFVLSGDPLFQRRLSIICKYTVGGGGKALQAVRI